MTSDFVFYWTYLVLFITKMVCKFINSFPSLMIGYVQKHYPDKVIKKIIRKSYGYYIKLSKPNPVELRFSKTGDYLREANKNEDDEQ